MSKPTAKRPATWKIVGIVLGVIALACIGLAVWASAAGSRRFERIRNKGLARLAEVKAGDARRPVLRGAAEPGNAWDDYAAGVQEVKKFADARKFHEVLQRGPKAEPEVAKAALAAHGSALDALRRGAGREASRYPYEWERGISMPLPALLDHQAFSNFSLLKARALLEEGKPREAAGVLLDVCQFGRDLGSDGVLISEMIGLSVLAAAFGELRDLLGSGKLDAAALEELGRGLEILDGSFPRNDQAVLNDTLLLGGSLDELGAAWGPQRLYLANGIDELNERIERVAKADALSWPEARKVYESVAADTEKSSNVISRIATPDLSKVAMNCRERRAQLRLLRMAVQSLASKQVPDLDDPFGAKLRSTKTGDAVKFWSVGSDGADDGGSGQWKGADGKDIVLELKK